MTIENYGCQDKAGYLVKVLSMQLIIVSLTIGVMGQWGGEKEICNNIP